MLKLSQEHQELLSLLLENKEELKVLYNVMEGVVQTYETTVNKVMVNDSITERDLLYKRLKAEGARKLLSDLGKVLKIKD